VTNHSYKPTGGPCNLRLNEKEIETLTWFARGKTSLEIA
jgi:hypothetical protein